MSRAQANDIPIGDKTFAPRVEIEEKEEIEVEGNVEAEEGA